MVDIDYHHLYVVYHFSKKIKINKFSKPLNSDYLGNCGQK